VPGLSEDSLNRNPRGGTEDRSGDSEEERKAKRGRE